MQRQREVLSLSTTDLGGGAEKMAVTIHRGLAIRNWQSRLVVGRKSGLDPDTIAMHSSPHFDYRTISQLKTVRLQRARLLWDKLLGREAFHYPFTNWLTSIAGQTRPQAILAHNLHGGYFDLRALPGLSQNYPFYWFLHDFWSFTGHCAFPLDCRRWQSGCGSCPHPEIPPAVLRDNTRNNRHRKNSIYRRSTLHLVVPSPWLADQVDRSILGRHGFSTSVIPYGIDLQRFRPCREGHAVKPTDNPRGTEVVAVFVANRPRTNPFKDLPVLEKALPELDRRLKIHLAGSVHLRIIAVGELKQETIFAGSNVTLEAEPYADEDRIIELLRSAGLYLHPTRNEITPLAIYEAMACGIPVIASDVGGIAGMIDHGKEGFLIADAGPGNWAEAIMRLVESPSLAREMGRSARARMLRLGGTDRMIDEVEALLESTARPG